jgi:NADH-quinone oxidoreductase subunit J
MLLSPAREQNPLRQMGRFGLIAMPLAVVFIGQIIFAVLAGTMSPVKGPYSLDQINRLGGSVQAVGRVLFTDYLLPFEVTSLLLIVALIGAVVLGKRRV